MMADLVIWPLLATVLYLVTEYYSLERRVRVLERKQPRPFKPPWRQP